MRRGYPHSYLNRDGNRSGEFPSGRGNSTGSYQAILLNKKKKKSYFNCIFLCLLFLSTYYLNIKKKKKREKKYSSNTKFRTRISNNDNVYLYFHTY